MADAVPSAASIIIPSNPDRPEGQRVLDMHTDPVDPATEMS